jgi:protein-disulfide isomerase
MLRSKIAAARLALAGCVLAGCAAARPAPVTSTAPASTAVPPAAPPAAAPAPPPAEALRVARGDAERYRVPVTEAQPVLGPADAPVTIVEWADYQCPFSARVEATLADLMRAHPGEIRRVWRNNPLPFHRDAQLAAELAVEAYAQRGPEVFWRLHETLFAHQSALPRADLETYAAEMGLDMTKVRWALDGSTRRNAVAADQELGRSLGATGTPAFFINGRFVSGAQPLSVFETIVADEVARASLLTQLGVAHAELYDVLTAEGSTEPVVPQAAEKTKYPDPAAVYNVPIGSAAQSGRSDALITIVEFAEFQCPFSKRVQATLAELERAHGRDLRIVYKHNPLPFHNLARPAAEAALAARDQGKFWEYHDLLFAQQDALERDHLEDHAQRLGLDLTAFRRALDTHSHEAEIAADQELARSLGATGTPTFFINGRMLRGAQPVEAFETVIAEELSKARERVAKGTPRSRLYEAISAEGLSAPKYLEGAAADAAAARGGAAPDPSKRYEVSRPADAPRRGAARGAKVVIQEFADFECPFSNRVQPTLRQIELNYGDRVQIVWRHYPLPFHSHAAEASEAAIEVYKQAGDEAFWRYHDLLFANQQQLGHDDLIRYAREMGGIDVAKLERALERHTHQKRVTADIDAITRAKLRIGTPSFVINGRVMQGAQAYPAFEAMIEAALAEP